MSEKPYTGGWDKYAWGCGVCGKRFPYTDYEVQYGEFCWFMSLYDAHECEYRCRLAAVGNIAEGRPI